MSELHLTFLIRDSLKQDSGNSWDLQVWGT